MNYGRAFSYAFEDPEWLKKVGIAALLTLTIIGLIPVLGWFIEIIRRVLNGEPDILPDWSNFSDFLTKGIQAFVISFVYSLPSAILNGCSNIFPVLTSNLGSGDNAQMIASVLSVVLICVSCIVLVYSIAIGLVLPAAFANFAASGQIGAGFRFGEIFGLVRAAPGPYIVVFLLGIVTSLIAFLGVIACFIGVYFTAAYAATINAHLYGQAYKAAKAAQGATMQPAGM